MTVSQTPILSIVIGAQNAHSTITPCLQSLLEQVKDLAIEILVVDDSTDGTTEIVANQFPTVRLIRSETQRLVPHLWGVGIQQAKSPIIAITTAHCIPSEQWIDSILETANSEKTSAGFGGAILPPDLFSLKDWAVYFTRYSAFIPPVIAGIAPEIAGDNAAYRKVALEKCWKNSDQGFWETLFHHELRQQGETLNLSPTIEVRLGETDNPWYFCQSRFRHGYHYGSTRPETSGLGRLIRIIAAPALMPFLIMRIGIRIAKQRPDWLLIYTLALPWLVTFLSAWSLGEVKGYLSNRQCDCTVSESTAK
ncbi:glycosyltransferase (plasmid) [Pseudanabaena biceps]|nr:glycosyltransferase [Pseudanabaena biceps]